MVKSKNLSVEQLFRLVKKMLKEAGINDSLALETRVNNYSGLVEKSWFISLWYNNSIFLQQDFSNQHDLIISVRMYIKAIKE